MTTSSESRQTLVSDNALAIAVYALYFAGYFTAFTAVIGVVIAHLKVDDADPVLRSHYQFQIRTFWIGVLYIAIGFPLCLLVVGFPILIWWSVWTLIRIIKGFIAVNEYKPIARPTSWLFG